MRLYDALGQILGDVAALPGVAEDDEAVDALVARRAALRAQRCYHVAEAHAAADATRGAARAVALLEHATELAQAAAQELEACARSVRRSRAPRCARTPCSSCARVLAAATMTPVAATSAAVRA